MLLYVDLNGDVRMNFVGGRATSLVQEYVNAI